MTKKSKGELLADALTEAERAKWKADQAELQRLRSELNPDTHRATLKLRAEQETLRAQLKQAHASLADAEKRVEFVLGLKDPERHASTNKIRKSRGQATAVMCINDWHIEEHVDPAVVNGKNEFTPKIAEVRIRKVFENCIRMLGVARNLSKIDDMVLAVLGDMINGMLHDDDVEGNFMSPTEACLFMEEQLVRGIDFLLKHADVGTITIPTNWGNHGRTGHKKRIAKGYANSFEWMSYNHLARLYRNEPRVQWKIERSYHNLLEIQGKKVRFHHGDLVNYWGGVGGVTIPLLKAIAAWDKAETADLDVLGHFHQPLRHHKFILSNCLIGYNPYAVSIKADYSLPSQTFFVIDRARPKPVFCEELYCD